MWPPVIGLRVARSQRGFVLIEMLIATVLLGVVVSIFLATLATGSRAVEVVDSRIEVNRLAQCQMETTLTQPFLAAPASYSSITAPPGYTITAEADTLVGLGPEIQRVVVSIFRDGEQLRTLEAFSSTNEYAIWAEGVYSGSAILMGAGESIFQVVNGVNRGVDQLTTLRDAENAALWLTRDARMAEVTDISDGASPVSSITLQWTDNVGGGSHTVTYAISGSKLVRNFDGAMTTVSRNINSVGFSRSARLLNLEIEVLAEGSTRSLQKNYSVLMRPE